MNGKYDAERRAALVLAGFAALLAVAVYLPALRNGFVWDDADYIVGNPHIRSLNGEFLVWAFTRFYLNNWHPVTWISHALDYALWGANPFGHHLTSILLHGLVTFFVVLLCLRLLEAANTYGGAVPDRRRMLFIAGTVGVLFAVHPVHVENVAWVTDRKDVLCGLFFVLSLFAYTGHARAVPDALRGESGARRFTGAYALSFLFFLLALMSKSMAVSLPLVLLLLDWHPFRRIVSGRSLGSAVIEKLPFFAASAAIAVLAVLSQQAGGALGMDALVPLGWRLLVAAHSTIVQLLHMAAPVGLSPFYQYPGPRELDAQRLRYLLAAGVVAAVTVLAVLFARRRRWWPSLWAYFVITFLPVSGVVQVGMQSTADRYAYLPGLAPFLAAALALDRLLSGKRAALTRNAGVRAVVVAAAVFAVIGLAAATVRQTAVWKDGLTFWNFVIARDPDRIPFAYNNRGLIYLEADKTGPAIEDFSRAVALDPELEIAYDNRGLAYEAAGRLDLAVKDFAAAIRLSPGDAVAYVHRGTVYLRMGKRDLALPDLRRACDMGSAAGCEAMRSGEAEPPPGSGRPRGR